MPGHYETESAEKTIDELNKLLALKSLDLHVGEVRKRGYKVRMGDNQSCQTLILGKMGYSKN